MSHPKAHHSSIEQLGLFGLGMIAVCFGLPVLDGWTHHIVENLARAEYGPDAAQLARWIYFGALGLVILGISTRGFQIAITMATTSLIAKFLPI